MEQSWFSTIDYQPPSLAAIQEGLRVVEERKRRKESVYIHCKAGRGRSALVTSCYLVKVIARPKCQIFSVDCTPLTEGFRSWNVQNYTFHWGNLCMGSMDKEIKQIEEIYITALHFGLIGL